MSIQEPHAHSAFSRTSPPNSTGFTNTMKQTVLRLLVENHDPQISVHVEITPTNAPSAEFIFNLIKNIMDEKLSCILILTLSY
jgi:hypothetical protein